MFESCWAHHSTRLHLAVVETKSRSWRIEGPHRSWQAIRRVELPLSERPAYAGLSCPTLKLLCHATARRHRHGESRLRAASWSGRILNQSHIVGKYITGDCTSCVLVAEVLIVDAK